MIKFSKMITEGVDNTAVEEVKKSILNVHNRISEDKEQIDTLTDRVSKWINDDVDYNNQIDDSYVDLKTIISKYDELINIFDKVILNFDDYIKNGEKKLY